MKHNEIKNKNTDCLLIGHNNGRFEEQVELVKKSRNNSLYYKELCLNYIKVHNKIFSLADFVNQFFTECNDIKAVDMFESFSAGIAYLGTFLKKHNLSFQFIRNFQKEKNELENLLKEDDILTVAIMTTYYVSESPLIEVVKFIRKFNKNIKIIVGGPFVFTLCQVQPQMVIYDMFLKIDADFYINDAQGEQTLVNLINCIKGNLDVGICNNLYYKNKQCDFIQTTSKKEDNRITENTVDWNLFGSKIGLSADIRTAISCPFSCAFCGFPQRTGNYQKNSIENILKELKALKDVQQLNNVKFIDDTFNVPKSRFRNILKSMIDENIGITWLSNYRAQFADDEIVGLMKESGCVGVFLGIESGSNEVLQNMNKKASIEELYRGIKLLKKNGIVTFGSFVIGFPGETKETVKKTIEFIENSNIDFYRVNLWFLDKITPIWNDKDKFGIVGEGFDWKHNTMDSREASEWVDEIFQTIKNTTWLTSYEFDFENIIHMLGLGFNLNDIKEIVNFFNAGIIERIKSGKDNNMSSALLSEVISKAGHITKCFKEGTFIEVEDLQVDFDI
jgi:radical SAM PhpK family P-methyltransferase